MLLLTVLYIYASIVIIKNTLSFCVISILGRRDLHEFPLANCNFSFLKDLHPVVAIVFILCFFSVIILFLILSYKLKILNHKQKTQKETHIHKEVLHISNNTVKNIQTVCLQPHTIPPDNTDHRLSFIQEYRKQVLDDAQLEYIQGTNGNITPIRKNRYDIKMEKHRKMKRSQL